MKTLFILLFPILLSSQIIEVDDRPIDMWDEYHLIISPRVTTDQFVSKSPDVEVSYIDIQLIAVISFLSSYYDSDIYITSAGRSALSNPGSSKSQHIYWRAVDFRIANKKAAADFRKQITNKEGEVFESLLYMGIKGFGVYSQGFFHIDTRIFAEMFTFNSDYGPMNYNYWTTFSSNYVNYNNSPICTH